MIDLAQPGALGLLEDLLADQVAARFAVTGESMRPFLAGGETVVLRRVQPDALQCGDLLLVRQSGAGEGRLLLHRVVTIRRRRGQPALIQTHGDALWAPDEPVREQQVLGRVEAVYPNVPGAEPLSLGTRRQRARGWLIALRQRTLWRSRQARGRLGASWGLRPNVRSDCEQNRR